MDVFCREPEVRGGMCFVKGAITVFMTLLFGMILSLVLVTIENVRFLTGECYALSLIHI